MSTAAGAGPAHGPPWPVLIVDDDPEVHAVTRLCLHGFTFQSRKLEWLSAHSGAEGRAIMAARKDIALVLLDVVMETDQAGLELARHIRDDLHNRTIRIVVRTGEPQARPLAVVDGYEIDDFRAKTDLTFERMTILVKSALRTYGLLRELEHAVTDCNEKLRAARA
ncbi:MAG: response regulator [Nevskiaceae bacterium]